MSNGDTSERNQMPTPNGWNEWSKYVLKELERLNTCYEKLDGKVDKINERMTLLQVKVAGIAAASAILTTLIFLIVSQIFKKG